MILSTLRPGSWPPSPGFAPCAILICRSSALTRYSVVTPNRPEATCLIAERIESHRLIGEFERHQPADCQAALALVVDRRRKRAVFGEGVATHRMLQIGDRLRRPGMVLAAQPEGVVAP